MTSNENKMADLSDPCAQALSSYITCNVILQSLLAAVCSIVTQRMWGGALRDDTKNGCEGD